MATGHSLNPEALCVIGETYSAKKCHANRITEPTGLRAYISVLIN